MIHTTMYGMQADITIIGIQKNVNDTCVHIKKKSSVDNGNKILIYLYDYIQSTLTL